jgi:hypothetical protein
MADADKNDPKKATTSFAVGCMTTISGGIAGGFLGRVWGLHEVHGFESSAHLQQPISADNGGLVVFSTMFLGLILGILFAHIFVKIWLRFGRRPPE